MNIDLNAPLPTQILQVDQQTCLLFFDVPGSKVVLFQGFFELYEGVGTVRTIDIRASQIMIITTPTMVRECLVLLNAISDMIPWRLIDKPTDYIWED